VRTGDPASLTTLSASSSILSALTNCFCRFRSKPLKSVAQLRTVRLLWQPGSARAGFAATRRFQHHSERGPSPSTSLGAKISAAGSVRTRWAFYSVIGPGNCLLSNIAAAPGAVGDHYSVLQMLLDVPFCLEQELEASCTAWLLLKDHYLFRKWNKHFAE
jgi:hypothetical protein